MTNTNETIKINRAPVLTLWAVVVAERMGFEPDEALTLGKALAGLNAQSKGQRLGIYKPHEENTEKARQRTPGEEYYIEVLGRPIPAVNTADGIRATIKGEAIAPRSVSRYLENKFGEALPKVRKAMQELASAYSVEELAHRAFPLYEKFRPEIPEGKKGWGALGDLDLDEIRALKPEK